MQLFSRNKALVALSLGALVALGACGDDVTVPAPVSPAETVSISPSNANMNVGESLNFAVQSTSSSATLASCTSSSATVATAAVNAGACRVTAVAAGNATITATTSTGKSAAAAVAVAAPAPAITGLTVSPSAAQVAVGSSVTLVPSATRANASVNVAYTYTSSATAVATVSSTGVVTAVAPGVATITIAATGTGTGLASASLSTAAAITVSDRTPGLTTLQVSPTTAALLTGGTQQVTATAQGPRASAATITYGTSAPAIATVSASGLITAVAPGTATITVTAQATQDGAFAASSITGLVTVTVTAPAQVTVSLSDITQGPTVTSYAATATSGGINSANNAQVGLAVDATNVRDQIQVVGTLAANGARVDSVVVYVADAAGANRVSAARREFANGVAASGDLTFFVNTADFTADFAAGTAAVRFSNGQRQLSISAWSGTTEVRAAATQTLAFNNVDGYAARLTAPARSATNATSGLLFHGGPDSLTASLGSATVVPVFYTAGRTLARATLSMRQGALGDTQVCSTARNNLTAAPFTARFGGAAASAGDTTLVNCSTLESDASHVIGVTATTDNTGSVAPITTYAAGFRTSASVTAPTALRLDYVAPTAVAIARPDSGWVNASYRFDTLTAPSTDAGVGMPGTTASDRRANRAWGILGCGLGSSTTTPATYAAFSGNANDVAECLSSNSAAAYTIRYTDSDRLGNSITSATATMGVDKTFPVISWEFSTTAADSSITTNTSSSYKPAVADAKSGISDSTTAFSPNGSGVTGSIARFGVGQWNALATAGRRCYTLAGADPSIAGTATVTAAGTTLGCSAYPLVGRLGTAQSTSGLRFLTAAGSELAMATNVADEVMVVSVTATDKAGNSTTSTRRTIRDDTAPIGTAGFGGQSVTATVNPAFRLNYEDLRMNWARLELKYGSSVLRYPAQNIASAFGAAYTNVTTNATSDGGALVSTLNGTLSTPMGAPFMLAVHGTSSYSYLSIIDAQLTDAAGKTASATDEAVTSADLPDLGTMPASTGSFATLSSLNAAGGAGAGLKAQFTATSLTGTNPFSRVDFYRRVSAGVYDYVGSSTTPVASTSATTGQPVWTFLSGPVPAISPANAATEPVGTGNIIKAVGVRSNGAAIWASDMVLGGASVRVTITGLQAGASATVTVSRGDFTQSTTASGVAGGGEQTLVFGVPSAGIYTVTATSDFTAGGLLYVANNITQNVTALADGAVTAAVEYTIRAFRAKVEVADLPAGSSTVLTFSKAGANNVTANAVNGFNVVTLPSGGIWTVTASAVTNQGRSFFPGKFLTGTFDFAQDNATITGTTNSTSLNADGIEVGDTVFTNGIRAGAVKTGGLANGGVNASGTITLVEKTSTSFAGWSTGARAYFRKGTAVLVDFDAAGNGGPGPRAGTVDASRAFTFVNGTPYRTWTWTLPTGVVPSGKLFYEVASTTAATTVIDSSQTVPTVNGIQTVTGAQASGATRGAAYMKMRLDPVTVGGITYGNSAYNPIANLNSVPVAGSQGTDLAMSYFAARISTAFAAGTDAACGANKGLLDLTAVAGIDISLTINGPADPVTFSRTISTTAINRTVAATGTYYLSTPSDITVASVVYRFIPSGLAVAPYQENATAHTITVCKR